MAEATEPVSALSFQDAIRQVEERLPTASATTAYPVLVMLVGLPGTGKSYLARKLAQKEPFVILEADFVRKTLFPNPTYSGEESAFVHQVVHALLARFLRRGVRVIYDATNLIEWQREFVYHLADRAGARLIIVHTVAPPEVVQARLDKRQQNRSPGDLSDADWSIYRRMERRQEPIRRPHLVIDTTGDMEQAVHKILRMARR